MPEDSLQPEAPTPKTPAAVDPGFASRHLPGVQAGETKGMLPGMALISMYLLVLAMLNAFAALRGAFGTGAAKFSVFGICTLLVIGVFGLLKLTRWGWSIVAAGCLLMAAGYFYGFHQTHIAPYIVQGAFALVFFLYLSRTEVRDRLK